VTRVPFQPARLLRSRLPGKCSSLAVAAEMKGEPAETFTMLRFLNQSQIGIRMIGRLKERGSEGEGGGPGLQDVSAATLNRCAAVREAAEEAAHCLANLGGSAEARVGGHLLAYPPPNGLVDVEVRAVGRQAYQAQMQRSGVAR
jgi:hypothetical protein